MIYKLQSHAKCLFFVIAFVQTGFFAFALTDRSAEVLNNIRKSRHLEESLLLERMAQQSFADGHYDMAEKFAEGAIKSAATSDEYVASQIKMYTADRMEYAREKLALADSAEVKCRYPSEFYNAKTYYNLGLIARDSHEWNDAINNADKVIKTLAVVEMPETTAKTSIENTSNLPVAAATPTEKAPETPPVAAAPVRNAPVDTPEETPLPAQYTVRAWDVSKDCFWNIAEKPWAYGNPYRWPMLYQANKKKLPDPNNPNFIEPGTVLDIPSLRGEKRVGLWDPGKTYSPLGK
jgi:tetratricopeptide (TPR) repeat protein